jgi:DNA polymerase III alpha subunit
MDYVHLHAHSENSFFDGLIKINQLFEKAKNHHMDAVALTEHHNAFSWFDLNEHAKLYHIKPIFGMELNVNKNHLTALAKNEKGVENLLKLNNIAYQKQTKAKVSEKELKEHSEGIIFLSGCIKGMIPQLIREMQFDQAMYEAREYKENLKGEFYIEIQNFKHEIYIDLTKKLLQIAKENALLVVPTNDCHYLEKDEHEYHKQLVSMHSNGKINPVNKENYYKTPDEMEKLFPKYVLEQTVKIANKCNVDFDTFVQTMHGEIEIPLTMFYYYDDAEAIKSVLYAKKEYKLAEFMYKKMRKGGLKLEDLYPHGLLKDTILFAYQLRGKLRAVEPDPYYYIKVNNKFPIWRKNKNAPHSAQIGFFSAQKYGFEIYDRRKKQFTVENQKAAK